MCRPSLGIDLPFAISTCGRLAATAPHRNRRCRCSMILWMILCVIVGCVCRYQVAHPPKQTTRPDPESRSDDKPEDPPQDLAVVDLTHSRNEKAQNCRCTWISHLNPLAIMDLGLNWPRANLSSHCLLRSKARAKFTSALIHIGLKVWWSAGAFVRLLRCWPKLSRKWTDLPRPRGSSRFNTFGLPG